MYRATKPLWSVLAATLLAAGLPLAHADEGCGRISTFDVAPRKQQLYPAVLIAIDGELPGPTSADSFRLSAGKHMLKVAEAIDPRKFSPLQNRERDGRYHDRYKELAVVVEPGITYRLAARLHSDRRDNMRSGNYWEPEIWTSKAESCH